jgi:hypothetical protein
MASGISNWLCGRRSRALGAAIVFAGVFTSIVAIPRYSQAAENTVEFDFSAGHSFGGVGLQVWALPQTPPALFSLLQKLAIHQVRMGSFQALPPSALSGGVSVSGLVQALHTSSSPDHISRWSNFAQFLKSRGIEVHLVVWEVPPAWRTEKTWTDAQGARQVAHIADLAHAQDYADYICAQILFAGSLGFPITAVELGNEPNGTWNTRWTPEEYSQLVIITRRTMNEAGLSRVGIEGPGTSTQRDAGPFLAALKKTGASDSLGAISVHSWDTRFSADPVGLTPEFRTEEQAVSRQLPLHVTEINDEAKRWRSEDPLSGTGKTKYLTANRAFALAMAAEVMTAIGDGATEALIWEAEDPTWEKSYLGLLDDHGQPRPTVDALGAILPFANSATRVVVGRPSTAGTQTIAFSRKNAVIVVVINSLNVAQGITFKIFDHSSEIGHLTAVACYEVSATGAKPACSQPNSVSPAGTSVSIPGLSILTMTFDTTGR